MHCRCCQIGRVKAATVRFAEIGIHTAGCSQRAATYKKRKHDFCTASRGKSCHLLGDLILARRPFAFVAVHGEGDRAFLSLAL